MIKRQIYNWLKQQEKTPQVVQIQGLRQTGKTTLMEAFKQEHPESLHYPLQNLVVLQRYQAEPARWALEIEQVFNQRRKSRSGPLHVFVDEIQKIPLFYQAIQGLYDAHKGKIKFWIWGSSARPTKRERAETLAGRVFTKILMPLSQSEIEQQESIIPSLNTPHKLFDRSGPEPLDYLEKLKKTFSQSLLPEAYLAEKQADAHALLESYQSTYLENEIRRENLVRDIGSFQRFLTLAASEDTTIVNHTAQAKVLGLSPPTIQNYYDILEDTFIITQLPAYSGSLRVQTSKSPKIYFADAGLARFIAGERGEIEPATRKFGNLLESFVLEEIKKQIEYHQLPWKLFYLRTKTNVEVDLIIQTPGATIATEIKSSKKVDHQDILPLKKLIQWDSSIKFGLIFSMDPRVGEIAPKIFNLPVWNL